MVDPARHHHKHAGLCSGDDHSGMAGDRVDAEPGFNDAGQHWPLLGVVFIVVVPVIRSRFRPPLIGAAGNFLGGCREQAGTACAAPAMAVHSAAMWKVAPSTSAQLSSTL